MRVHQVYFAIAVSIAIIGLLLLTVWAPWHQVYPDDPHKVVAMARIPLWSHSDLPGARVNAGELLLEAAIILAIALMIARIGRGTRSTLQLPKR